MAGSSARAARERDRPAPGRPSGVAEEKGGGIARLMAWFVQSALKAAEDVHFPGRWPCWKEPPRAGSGCRQGRVSREIDGWFTGVAIAARTRRRAARRGARAAAVCQLELV